jgi:hypothetical protein
MSANTDLLAAASSGDLAALEAALAAGADIEVKADFDDTALNLACRGGHAEIVRRLLAAGAAIENVGGADQTPLMNAAFGGHVGLVRTLLEAGARINDDLLMSLAQKVSILEENAENGMVLPQAAEAWRGFLDFMVAEREKQDGA